VAWGWLQDVPPNVQNTAEVILGLMQAGSADAALRDRVSPYLIANTHDPEHNVRDRGWIALALTEMVRAGGHDLSDARDDCAGWLIGQQNDDNGWSVTKGEPSLVPTTALAIEALRTLDRRDAKCAVRRGTDWIKEACRLDGGWSLISPGVDELLASEENLEPRARGILLNARTESNAACTAFAMLSFIRTGAFHAYVERGANWLLDHQIRRVPGDRSTGGWPVFRERGIRASEWYTFRHFSTAWALIALCEARGNRFARSRAGLEAVQYLLDLQDPVLQVASDEGGGWRTSPDGEPYTWATVNAIAALREVASHLDPTSGENHLAALRAELSAAEARVTFIPSRGARRLAFNARSLGAVGGFVTILSIAWIDAEIRRADSKLATLVLSTVALLIVGTSISAAIAAWRNPEAPRFGAYAAGAVAIVSLMSSLLGVALFV
jgi:squalene-hopene/tetraprenyl-beta-curcumene cyclase